MSDTLGTAAQAAKLKAAETRAQLADTLDAIEDKLNVPKRVKELGSKAASSYQQNRTPWFVVGGAVAAVVIGVVAWAIFSDD